MPSEQPREGTRAEQCRCGFPFYEDRFTIPRLDGGSVPDAWEFCPYCGGRLDEPAQPQPRGEARVECPSCGSNHPGRKKAVQHSPGRPFASKWCDDGFHEPAPEGEKEAS